MYAQIRFEDSSSDLEDGIAQKSVPDPEFAGSPSDRLRSMRPWMRLADLWAEIFDLGNQPIDHELLGWLLRAAYGQGYTDALRETQRGQLCLDLGYRVPDRAA